MAKANDITVVSAEVPQNLTEDIYSWLIENEIYASVWEDREGGPSRIEIVIPDDPSDPEWAVYGDSVSKTCDEASLLIKDAGRAFDLDLSISITVVKAENWAESWKRFFKTIKISDHLTVCPPWENYEPKDGEKVLVLDPGMSFGTGKHATTQGCMILLDKLAREDASRDVLDIGCGSGILSIAAYKLGFSSVRGIDNDPDAVRIAKENSEKNGVTATFKDCDLAACEEKSTIVVANVLAVVLEKFASQVSNCVRRVPNNKLILSGILDEQYDGVRKAYTALGAKEEESVLIGEWRTGLFSF